MNIFYHPDCTTEDAQLFFDKEESRHISKSLRKKEGDFLYVTNGKGQIFTSKIAEITSKQIVASITKVEEIPPLLYQLHMAVAPTKNNTRFEWFLEKATEIGIHTITPILCEHSERKVIKQERLQKIIESAMKQSLKAYKPILEPLTSFTEFVEKAENKQKVIAHCHDLKKMLLHKVAVPKSDIVIVIGPEGDFSSAEIDLAIKNNFIPVSLGDSRLRTETAAVVACQTVSLINQD